MRKNVFVRNLFNKSERAGKGTDKRLVPPQTVQVIPRQKLARFGIRLVIYIEITKTHTAFYILRERYFVVKDFKAERSPTPFAYGLRLFLKDFFKSGYIAVQTSNTVLFRICLALSSIRRKAQAVYLRGYFANALLP